VIGEARLGAPDPEFEWAFESAFEHDRCVEEGIYVR